jgi:hypothetical protein
LWELLTRLQPYGGMSPAAIAVSVIRDNLRPPLPEEGEKEADGASHEYRELLTNCWHQDPTVRPTFLVPHPTFFSFHLFIFLSFYLFIWSVNNIYLFIIVARGQEVMTRLSTMSGESAFTSKSSSSSTLCDSVIAIYFFIYIFIFTC